VEVGSVEIIAGTGGIMGVDIWATVDERLHERSPRLATELRFLVENKTPVWTGALMEDVQEESYPAPGGDDLVWIYSANEEQLIAWNRIYVEYQEGGPLGLPTYTNDPRQMYYDTAAGDGLLATEFWALEAVNEAMDMVVGGAGIPI
jgi:hypothetical protein